MSELIQEMNNAVTTEIMAAIIPTKQPPRKIIVVLPAFNEESALGLLLSRIAFAMVEEGLTFEVIIVDDGSSDKTYEIAKMYSNQMPMKIERHVINQGLGATMRDGLKIAAESCAKNDIIVVMDADNTHTPGLILSMVRSIKEGCDVTIASRYQPGAYVRGLTSSRRLLSYCASLLFRIVFPIRGVRDYTCGYRAYRGGVLKSAFDKYGETFVSEEGFQCMVDILLKLRTMDVIFREIPLILRYDFKTGASKMKVAKTTWNTLGLMFRRRIGISN
jgi:dolichol-phosphate mannosyltransferase